MANKDATPENSTKKPLVKELVSWSLVQVLIFTLFGALAATFVSSYLAAQTNQTTNADAFDFSKVKIISFDPLIVHITDFVSKAEREHLLKLGYVTCTPLSIPQTLPSKQLKPSPAHLSSAHPSSATPPENPSSPQAAPPPPPSSPPQTPSSPSSPHAPPRSKASSPPRTSRCKSRPTPRARSTSTTTTGTHARDPGTACRHSSRS